MTQQPIIILGMHRSGTSMIARLLESLGLFIGDQKSENYEARFFQSLDEWLLHQSGASWDQPKCIYDLLNNKELRVLVMDYINHMMKSPWAISYLGLLKFPRYRAIQNIIFPFGWKNPRSTFTLPIWLDIFPEARIIHIYRHGVDVAYSLQTRNTKELSLASIYHEKQKRRLHYWLRPKRNGFLSSLRTGSLEHGVSLWEQYNKEARNHVNSLGNRAIEIKYEDFLEKPFESLCNLANFCGLNAENKTVEYLASTINSKRAFAYQNNPVLCMFAGKVENQLKMMGY